jgi:hypothetical protein
MDYDDLSKGVSLRYGEPERWKKIAEKYGTTKPTRAKKLIKEGAGVKDRRPPDTSKALLKKSSKKRTVADKSDKEEEEEEEIPKKYQSYPHYKNSCYITALLELLYNNFIKDKKWWDANIGIVNDDNLGIKKLYTSFAMRHQPETTKKTLSEARELIRRYVIDKGWQKDGEFGSLTWWFYNMVFEKKHSLNIISHFCVLGIRMWECGEGHIRISPTPINPFFPINGTRDFDDPYFTINPGLVGEVSEFFSMKNKLINRVHSDEPCQHSRAHINSCNNRKHQYEELIISWPTLLVFEVTQELDSYNSSKNLGFPSSLSYNNDEIGSIKYKLTARAFSTSSRGVHYYAKIIRNNVIYKYDDLKNQGVASLESKDLNSLSGQHLNTTLVAYDLCDEDSSTRFSDNRIG